MKGGLDAESRLGSTLICPLHVLHHSSLSSMLLMCKHKDKNRISTLHGYYKIK